MRGRIKSEPGIADSDGESIEVLAERLRKRLGHVTVPRNFSRLHPTIETLLRKDEKLRQEAANSPLQFSWKQPKFDTPFERRRLLFLNGLFLGFAKVVGNGWVRGHEARELAIYMGDASVSFDLDAPSQSQARQHPAPNEDRTLRLTIATAHSTPPGIPFSWRDEDRRTLEQQLTEIIIGMAVADEHLHRKWLEQQAAWRRKQQEEAELEAQRRKAEEGRRECECECECIAAFEENKRDALRRDAKAWREATDIRAYVEAVRQAADALDFIEIWANWAPLEADKVDPIASGRALNGMKGRQVDHEK